MRHLLMVSLPLVINAFVATLNLFFDRLFLSYYDIHYHMTVPLTAGMCWWAVQHLPIGIVTYAGTFVAQYFGAARHSRIGAAMWAAAHIALLGGLLNILLFPLWGPFFNLVHPTGPLAGLEAAYCRALTFGAFFLLLSLAFSTFYSGRGKTVTVMVIGAVMSVSNILFNWWLIFSPPAWLPFIQPGSHGAAWGTNFSFVLGAAIYLVLIAWPKNERAFKTLSSWRWHGGLIRRLIRYGGPQGVNLVVELGAFAFFVLMIARVDEVATIASNIAFTANMILFLPMLMVAQGVSILVGQFIGRGQIARAERVTSQGMLINSVLMTVSAAAYILVPGIFIGLFLRGEDAAAVTPEVFAMARVYLIIIAAYTIGDAIGVTMAGAIKGAGDTAYVMWVSTFCALFLLVGPCLVLGLVGASPTWMWIAALFYITISALLYLVRYRAGKWREMKVIEPELSLETPKLDVAGA